MSDHDTDDMKKKTDGRDDPLVAAINADRAARPAPGFSASARDLVMAKAAERVGQGVSRHGAPPDRPVIGKARLSTLFGDLLRPNWQVFAAAGVAGMVAGVVLTQGGIADTLPLTPEEQFAAYLDAGSGLDALLEEDL